MKEAINFIPLHKGCRRNCILTVVFGLLCGLFLGSPGVGLADDIEFQDVNPDFTQFPNGERAGNGQGSGGRVNGLASVPGTNKVFYAATEWGGLYKTTNGGRRWFRLDGHLPYATRDVKVDPANPQIVYATSLYDGRVQSLAGINVSRDGGVTWEHPPTATPPDTFNCRFPVLREEPNAYGISVDPRDSRNVYIGFSCGLAISNNRGQTWRFVNPDSTAPAVSIFDVVVHYDEQDNQVIDLCGNGHFRYLDGGNHWQPGNGLPMGYCSIAVSPDESYVLLANVGTTIWQTVDGGQTWVQNINNPSPQGRIPFVATNQRANDGNQDVFDLWFGDVGLHRFRCTTPPEREQSDAPRCPANPVPGDFAFPRGAHPDAGDLAFDTQATNDACPLIFSSDGGVYRNTITASPACHEPSWTQPEVSPHALWLWTLAGAHQPGVIEEDLYFGTQDNGPWFTTRGGDLLVFFWSPQADWQVVNVSAITRQQIAGSVTSWLTQDGPFTVEHLAGQSLSGDLPNSPPWTAAGLAVDTFTFAATPTNVAHFWVVGPTLTMLGRAFTGDGGPNICFSCLPLRPGLSGTPPGFRFLGVIVEWGEQNFALVTQDSASGTGGLFITENKGFTWRELGNNNNEPSPMCAIQAAFSGRVPVFYVQVGGCEEHSLNNRNQLWKFVGTNPSGSWERIRLPAEAKGSAVSLFAVDRSNANRLYASLIFPLDASNDPIRNPQMIFSQDGGASWRRDVRLDRLMTGFGAFRYQTRINGGTAQNTNFPAPFGYPQPSLLAFDPHDSSLIIAGGRDSGVFLSRDGGKHWELVTDPFDPVGSGIPHLTSPRHAYFDHDPSDAIDVYIGTVGRGVWRMRIPR